jgi:hypothetical protein
MKLYLVFILQKMTTITVEVPLEIAKRYGKKIVSYKELLRSIEE